MDKQLKVDIKTLLSTIISDEYIDKIYDVVLESILTDVINNSEFKESGNYSIDDIRLAIGRELMDKYELW